MDSTFFTVIAVTAILLQSFLLFLFFFEPRLRYKVWNPPSPTSPAFLNMLVALLDVRSYRIEPSRGTDQWEYFSMPNELSAIQAAQMSINLEAYIFHEGEVTRLLIEALAERSRAAVKVNLVIDAPGGY